MKKVLIITYYWPPAGGPGVQRVLKFAKYLPQFGWQPIILTVKDGEYPAYDESLCKDIPPECKVYRTSSLEPSKLYKKFTGMSDDEAIPVATLSEEKKTWKKKLAHWIRLNLFIPDAKIGWIPFAVKTGKRIIKQEQPDIIFSSSPPPTVHLIARKLAKWSKLKWVADFRDPWTEIHYYSLKKNYLARKCDQRLERKVIADCNRAVCASYSFIDLLTSKYINKFTTITNGFDTKVEFSQKSNEKIRIIYTGGITSNRFYKKFFKDIALKATEDRSFANSIEIILAGKIENKLLNWLKILFNKLNVLKIVGYIKHEEALDLMRSADILLLFLEKKENYEGHIPAKIFEYLTTGNYIIGIGSEDGDSAMILKQTNCGIIYSENNDFAQIIKQLIPKLKEMNRDKRNLAEINKYSRKELTKKLLDVFEKNVT